MSDLNPAQRQAVVHEGGPLLVFAGAGSGKTRVITRRIAHAVSTRRVQPEAVMALTFTNKAAKEMAHRVEQLLPGTAGRLTVGTFHSTCARWLRTYGPTYGHSKDFAIYDSDDQKAVIRRVLVELGLDADELTPKAIARLLDRAKNAGQFAQDVCAGEDSALSAKFPAIYRRYEEKLGAAGALDFGDLILHMVAMLERDPEARSFFADRFRMLLVDEYQDTNHSQYRLLKLIASGASPDLCVVGDDDQSIYKFRGADVGNILAFRRDYPGTTVVKLEENYRSIQPILDVSNSVIRHNRQREPKRLQSVRGAGGKPRLFVHESERHEAEWVAASLLGHAKRGGNLSEVAVLFRQNSQSRVLEETLARARIPFLLVGGQRFYERAEVKDALAYLRLLVRPESEIDLVRIINTPARGIGDKTVERLAAHATRAGTPLIQAALAPPEVLASAGLGTAAAERVSAFGALLRRWAGLVREVSPRQVLIHVLNESGLIESLRGEDSIEAEGRLRNLEELVSAVEDWSSARPEGTLAEYLEDLALLTDLDRADLDRERAVLMTVHAAKGLEFRRVLMVGLEENLFPVARREAEPNDIEEERRLFYVGVTRAMDELALSACQTRLLYGQRQVMEPSRFLLEIPSELLAKGEASPSPAAVRASAQAAPTSPRGPRPGQRVRHASFGEGQVVASVYEGERLKVVVDFPGVGRKTILSQYLQ